MALIDQLRTEYYKKEEENKLLEEHLANERQKQKENHFYDDKEIELVCHCILGAVENFMFNPCHSKKKKTTISGWAACHEQCYNDFITTGCTDGLYLCTDDFACKEKGYTGFRLDDPQYIKEKLIEYIQKEYRVSNPTVIVERRKINVGQKGLFAKKYLVPHNRIYVSFPVSK